MTTLSELQTITHPANAKALFAYLQHKQIGGTNNAKGNKFENYFTVFKIAQHWNEDPHNTLFSAQELCFVDDLVIQMKTGNQHFQIKDVQNISWKSGNHSLADDFYYQLNLYQSQGKKTWLYMVVSGKGLATRLRNTRSKRLQKTVTVHHFPAANSINRLLATSMAFRKAITSLCALSNPQTDKLETIATQILAQWEGSNKTGISMGYITDGCLKSSPQFFKGGANHVSTALATLLNSINGLTFTLINGTLEWNFNNGTDVGVLPYKIGSLEFIQFENDLIQFPPGVAFQTIEHLFI